MNQTLFSSSQRFCSVVPLCPLRSALCPVSLSPPVDERTPRSLGHSTLAGQRRQRIHVEPVAHRDFPILCLDDMPRCHVCLQSLPLAAAGIAPAPHLSLVEVQLASVSWFMLALVLQSPPPVLRATSCSPVAVLGFPSPGGPALG